MNHIATQEVAQVTKGRSGGSAKVKAKRRELQMKTADMLKFDICGEMNPLDIFCIGRNEFSFHLDGELNRDG